MHKSTSPYARWSSIVVFAFFSCGGEQGIEHVPIRNSLLVGPISPRGSDALPKSADFNTPFTALFAPDDPTLTLELSLIDAVVTARQADSRSYSDATNPYRIRYSVTNLSHRPIAERLADAKAKGVFVQIQIDSRCIDLTHLADTFTYLISKGFKLAADNRTLTDTTRLATNLIGIKMTSGFMHTKMRLFETPSQKWVLTGSQNPSSEAQQNEETLHLIHDTAMFTAYSAAYEAIQRGQRIANSWTGGAALNVLFSPAASGPFAGRQLLDWIEAEREQILLSVFCIRDISAPGASRKLIELLAAKVAAGVPVWVLTDRKQSDGVDAKGTPTGANDATEDALRAAGVHVYEVLNTAGTFTAMHSKAAILGRTRLRIVTDTANFSTAAFGSATAIPSNYESVLFIDSSALDGGITGRRYLGQWLKVLSRWADQSAADGEPSFAAAYRQLSMGSGWPSQTVTFVAEKTYTAPGEEVRVLGEPTALGSWGIAATGVFLRTDSTDYPTWKTPVAATLPIGSWFEWKLAIGWGTTAPHRWESGGNRSDFVQLGPFAQRDVLSYVVEWK